MFIPRYWSEASEREVFPGRRQVTVRRFGWSSTSQEEADVHARQRVEEALAVLRTEGPDGLRDFTRRERVVAYSGSDGLPIREEIVEEHPAIDVVLTRNSYGAVCLNTTRAMFVDVDGAGAGLGVGGLGCLGFLIGGFVGIGGLAPAFGRDWDFHGAGLILPGLAGAFAGLLATWLILRLVRFLRSRGRDPLEATTRRVEKWCEERRDWLVAVYETPAGARLLPLHATFDAAEESTFEFMAFVRADPLYVRMCRLQKCFRARVSPKPWRAGVNERFRAGGTWPVRDPGKLARRAAWVRAYEARAGVYASCRLAETVGRGRRDPDVEEIRRLHDRLCRADSNLELA